MTFTAIFANGQTEPERRNSPFSEAEIAKIQQERTPNLKKFRELLDQADRVVIVYTGEGEQKVLFGTAAPADLAELKKALSLQIPEDWRESICPTPMLKFYRGKEELMSVSNVLGREVKTSVWSGNALLNDPEKWLAWFDKRGMPELRKETDDADAAARKFDKDEKRWYAAMPRGIKEPFEKQTRMFGLPSMGDTSAFKAVLEREYPDRSKRILAVLNWYGSGSGAWSGYPSYESIAGDILFTFSTAEIVGALKSRKPTDTETEGAARFFSGWDFYKKRPDDLRLISDELKRFLLSHALKSSDEDKRSLARKSFVIE